MGATYSTPKVPSVHFTRELVDGLPDQTGKVVIITGTSAGSLGYVVAQTLLEKGAKVICLNRNPDKCKELAGDVAHVVADLMSFASVREAAIEVKKLTSKIDILCLNAGVMMLPDQKSVDGYDVQMATNHLAHFLLTKELFPLLSPDARVVTQSSEARNGPPAMDLQEQFFQKDLPQGALGNNLGLGRTMRYQQSKLANAVFSYALRQRLAARNSKIQSLLVHPGVCASNLGQTAADSANSAFGLIMAMIMSQAQSTEDGALPMILAAVEPSPPVFSGPNEGIRWLGLNYIRGYPRELQPEKYCVSEENKELLWEKSLEAIGSREWLSDEEVVTVIETKCRAIDLGHPFDSQTIFWPGGEGFSLCMSSHGSNDTGDFYAAGSFSCAEHGGTHIDAPWHFNQDGRTVERLALSELIAKVRVIRTFNGSDSQALARSDERNATVECILAHEKEHGLIPAGCIVCFFTGWSFRYSSGPLAYLGWDGGNKSFDAASKLDFPGLDPDAARLLVQRRVAGVGIDTASLDPGSNKNFDAHRILLGSGVYGIENLSDELSRIPSKGATLVALPLKITGGSGSPARVVAFVQ